jgi:hypothetical protein
MINVNQQALLELLKASLFGAEPHFPEDVDWDAVLQEAKDQTVVALAAPAVPKEEAPKWQVPSAQNKMRFFQILDEQTKLVKLFQDAGIPLVILKGCAAAMYYPEPLQRTMGDIDFIVPPKRFEDARRLMMEKGYEFDHDIGDDRDYCYRKGDIFLELHHHYSDPGWNIDPLIADGMVQPIMCELYGKTFPVLPVEINGLVLLDHVRHHLFNGLGIRQIIDWMMFVHAFLDDETWKHTFAPLARDAGLETLAITMTKMCKLWFGLPDSVAWCEKADEETARQLLDAVFVFGNFGRKTSHGYHPVENVIVGIREHGFFRYLQNTGKTNWKACQKYVFLSPFAWLFQLFRFVGRGFKALFRGDRLAGDVALGTKKADFYRRLGLEK